MLDLLFSLPNRRSSRRDHELNVVSGAVRADARIVRFHDTPNKRWKTSVSVRQRRRPPRALHGE